MLLFIIMMLFTVEGFMQQLQCCVLASAENQATAVEAASI
jgi:hypothetical protein